MLMRASVSILLISQIFSLGQVAAAEPRSKAEAASSKLSTAVEDNSKMRREAAKVIGALIGAIGTYSGRCMHTKIQTLRGAKKMIMPEKIAVQTEDEALTELLNRVLELQSSLDTLIPEDEGYWQSLLREFLSSPLLLAALNTEALELIDLASEGLTGLGTQGPLTDEIFARKEAQQREVSRILQALEALISSKLHQTLKVTSQQTTESSSKRKETTR